MKGAIFTRNELEFRCGTVEIRDSHGARGGDDASRFVGGEVVRERHAVEIDERVAHGVLEGVRRWAPTGVPDAALVEPRGGGGGSRPASGVMAALEEEAEEEEEGLEGGGDEGSGQGGEQVERLHGRPFQTAAEVASTEVEEQSSWLPVFASNFVKITAR